MGVNLSGFNAAAAAEGAASKMAAFADAIVDSGVKKAAGLAGDLIAATQDQTVGEAEKPNASSRPRIDNKGGAKEHRPIIKTKSAAGIIIVEPKDAEEKAEQHKQNANQFAKEQKLFDSAEDKERLASLAGSLDQLETADAVLDQVKAKFPNDPQKQRLAFEFLLQNATGDVKVRTEEAKSKFDNQNIAAVRHAENIAVAEKSDVKKPAVTNLDQLTDSSGDAMQATPLLQELIKKYNTTKDISAFANSALHLLGIDLKSSEAVDAKLVVLGKEAQLAQAILAFVKVFVGIPQKAENQLMRADNNKQIASSEQCAKTFVEFLADQRISAEKILRKMSSLVH